MVLRTLKDYDIMLHLPKNFAELNMSDPKTTIASYTASGGLVLFGMSLNDVALLSGIFFAAATVLINWYYKHRHLKLIEAKVQAMPEPEET